MMKEEPSENDYKWFRVMVEAGRVTKLKWDCKDLTGTNPADISALSALTNLDLSGKELEYSVPPEFGRLRSLCNLSLYH